MSDGIRNSGPAVTIHGATLPAPDYRDARIAELTAKLRESEDERERLQKRLESVSGQLVDELTERQRRGREVERLVRALAEAQKDTERLDAAEAGHWSVSRNDRAGGWIVQRCMQVVGNVGRGRTLRAALDSARTGGQQ